MPKSKKSKRTKRRCKFGICPSRPESSSSSTSKKKTRKPSKKKTSRKAVRIPSPKKQLVAVSYRKKSRTPRKADAVEYRKKSKTSSPRKQSDAVEYRKKSKTPSPRKQSVTPLREPPCPPFQFTPHKLTPRQGGEILPLVHVKAKLEKFIKDLFIDDKKERIKNTLEYIIKGPELEKKYLLELIKFIDGFNDKYLILEDGELHPYFKKCLYGNLDN